MDVRGLLQEARTRSRLSQRQLAERAGTSRGRLASYESGRVSPTVDTLDRLLAACALQARVHLEPLTADLDRRVDAVEGGLLELDVDQLRSVVLALEDAPEAFYPALMGRRPLRPGPVRWALDGHTALQLQGYAVPGTDVVVAAVLDDALRTCLCDIGAQAVDLRELRVLWKEASEETVREATRAPFFSHAGTIWLRLVEELPPVLDLAVPWHSRPVRVLPGDRVEEAWPDHAELMARLRYRRSLTS